MFVFVDVDVFIGYCVIGVGVLIDWWFGIGIFVCIFGLVEFVFGLF